MRTGWARASIAIAMVLVVGACSGSEETPEPAGGSEGGGPADGVVNLTMAGFAFEPSSVTLPGGDSLTVRNEDTATHTFTMDDGSLDVSLEPGQQVEVTPETGGAFHCEIHPSMTGTLTIG